MEKVPQWVVVAAVALVAIVLAWAGQLAAEWIPGISSKWLTVRFSFGFLRPSSSFSFLRILWGLKSV
jgi:hypothetical protein